MLPSISRGEVVRIGVCTRVAGERTRAAFGPLRKRGAVRWDRSAADEYGTCAPDLGEGTVEDDGGDGLCLLDEVVDLHVELAGGGVVCALDVAAVPVVVAHVDDAVVLHGDLVALDDRRELLGARGGQMAVSARVPPPPGVLTSGVMYFNIAGDLGGGVSEGDGGERREAVDGGDGYDGGERAFGRREDAGGSSGCGQRIRGVRRSCLIG